MPRGHKDAGEGREGKETPTPASQTYEWMNAQLFDKIWEGASFVSITWSLSTYPDVVTQRVTLNNNNKCDRRAFAFE